MEYIYVVYSKVGNIKENLKAFYDYDVATRKAESKEKRVRERGRSDLKFFVQALPLEPKRL